MVVFRAFSDFGGLEVLRAFTGPHPLVAGALVAAQI